MNLRFEEVNESNKVYHNIANQPFEVFGRLIIEFKGDKWSYSEELLSEPYMKHYPGDYEDVSNYIVEDNRTIFYAFLGDECVGQIAIRSNWNNLCFIDDVGVAANYRKMNIGTELLKKAEEWAKGKNHVGFMLETQDVNLGACRFYIKNGFELGGVDVRLYSSLDNHEKGLFWYRLGF